MSEYHHDFLETYEYNPAGTYRILLPFEEQWLWLDNPAGGGGLSPVTVLFPLRIVRARHVKGRREMRAAEPEK